MGTAAEAPVTEDGTFAGTRGRRIYWQSWSPAGDQRLRGTVAIAHGLGEHLGRYRYVAERLVADGYAVHALDHHGHGRSEGTRARIALDDAVADLDTLIAMARDQRPGLPLYLLGHSLGGAIALRYALGHQDRLDGLLLSGPLASLNAGPLRRGFGLLLGRVAPWMPATKIDPRWISRDPAVVARYITDRLVHHRAIPAATVREILVHVRMLPGSVDAIKLPALLMYGTEDRLCPPEGSVMLTERIGSEDLTTQAYEGLFHEVLNEPERDRVLDRVLNWLDQRSAAARPSPG